MKFTVVPFVAGLLYALGVSAQAPDPSINTPASVVECLPVQLTFSGTKPPFIITIHPGGHPELPALKNVATTSATSVTWVADLPAGTQYTLVIRDAAGATNPSAPFTIQPGAPGCLGSIGSSPAATGPGSTSVVPTISVSSTSTPPAASSPVITTRATSTTTPAAAGTTTPAAGGTTRPTTTASGTAPASTTTSNAAGHMQPVGLAGLLGAVGAVVAMF